MRLLFQPNDETKQWWTLSRKKMTLGRDPTCDVVIQDPRASRIHAEILYQDGQFFLLDKNSTNGTFVNGARIERQNINPGDALVLGSSRFIVVEGMDTSALEWLDGELPQVTAQLSLDVFGKKLSEISAVYSRREGLEDAKAALPEGFDVGAAQKLMKNLQIIYDLSRDFTNIMVFKELFDKIKKYIYDIFPEVERFCILTRTEEKKEFTPQLLSARNQQEEGNFDISRSIFNLTVEKKVSVLTVDAAEDARFQNSESIVGLNLRSSMCAPLVIKGEVIGAIYCDNRAKPACFDDQDLELFTAMANQFAVALSNTRLYEEVQRAYHESILALINAIEAKDPYTIGHTQRTSRYALGIAQEMNLSDQQRHRLKTSSELHDIGKIGVKEKIISKAENLSNSEYQSVKEHVIMGEKILKPISYLHFVLPIIRGHHEFFDGSGYPDGLKGEEILLESRILTVADAFDAMTTQRPYNAPMSFAEALKECKNKAGSQFDPVVVDALERYISANYELTDVNIFKKMQSKGETASPF
ncbi:FHA domain-containing protein [Candidatus Sumerlaeota bacterium]|nr:FHA domain-containing protein [Candidatus Sumerlaeota bacterium]